ncbi:MAG TPA: phosphatase PAP2 family protein [Solirubrobacteraceae bacterium]
MLRSPRIAFAAAASCVAGFVVLLVAMLHLPALQARDLVAARGFRELGGPRTDPILTAVAHIVDPHPYVLIGAALAALAFMRRRPRSALAILVLLPLTGATTEILKHALHAPLASPGEFPSGHATASMTLALCAVLAAPQRLRPITAVLGAAFAVGVSYSIIALDWHSPTDIIGGFLVAAAWAAAVLGVLLLGERRTAGVAAPAPGSRDLAVAGGAALAGVLVAGAALAVRTGDLPAVALTHATAAVAAAVIATAALGLAAATARLAH